LKPIRVLAMAIAAQVALSAGASALAGEAEDQIEVAPVRTGKERLGGKASDEQRVDNCKVPPILRGPKPRPDECQYEVGTGAKH
jgi:hypothetical protein